MNPNINFPMPRGTGAISAVRSHQPGFVSPWPGQIIVGDSTDSCVSSVWLWSTSVHFCLTYQWPITWRTVPLHNPLPAKAPLARGLSTLGKLQMGQFCNGDTVTPMTSQRTDDIHCSFAGKAMGQTVPLRDNGSKFRKVLLIGPVRARDPRRIGGWKGRQARVKTGCGALCWEGCVREWLLPGNGFTPIVPSVSLWSPDQQQP